MEPTSTAKRFFLDSRHRFVTSVGVAILVFFALLGHVAFATHIVFTWDAFATSSLLLTWLIILTQDPYEVRRIAPLQDSSRTAIFVLVVFAAVVSLFAVFLLLGSAKSATPAPAAIAVAFHFSLSVAAIVLSWALVHTLFALRYAHHFYADAHKLDRDAIEGGLIFPGDENPDYADFAYFSFIIGMTCQVSDVQIASKHMRRLATIHGLIAFTFNTAILALFVNIVAGLV
jgi:uncharacterized membrane protein